MPIFSLAEIYQNMPTFLLAIVFFVGLGGLILGGHWLLRGAVNVAILLRIQPVIIGLTVVSAATSMPEFFTSLLGTIRGSDGLAIGNIVGSNIANIGLILAIAALISPLKVRLRLIRLDVPILVGISFLFVLLAFDSLSRIDGLVLLAVLAGYLFFLVREKREDPSAEDEIGDEIGNPGKHGSLPAALFWVVLGGVALAVGADLLVRSSVEFAGRMGVNEFLIGLTVVAIGTSLPELAASVVAAVRKEADLSIGNIVGSNIFNLLLVGGFVATIEPIQIDERLYRLEFPFMIGFALILWPFFLSGKILSRREGFVLLLFYAAFLVFSTLLQVRG